MPQKKAIIAVCGKGGVGKTAFSALFSRILKEAAIKPLLLIDADPAGGLVSAIGEETSGSLAGVREHIISTARNAGDTEKTSLANQLDYLVMEVLSERSGYSFLAIGRSKEKGCYCPANSLLRGAIELLSEPFTVILIDAEAGLEQIQRQVTKDVTKVIAISDGSQRSRETIEHIVEMVGKERLSVVINRAPEAVRIAIPDDLELLGSIPEDDELKDFDRSGRPLWELSPDNKALLAVRDIALKIGFEI